MRTKIFHSVKLSLILLSTFCFFTL
ncbi:MAG: hypothetical protein XD81_1223, partial [Bacteroidetes bacterium 38_7]